MQELKSRTFSHTSHGFQRFAKTSMISAAILAFTLSAFITNIYLSPSKDDLKRKVLTDYKYSMMMRSKVNKK